MKIKILIISVLILLISFICYKELYLKKGDNLIKGDNLKINVIINNNIYQATILNNETSKQFINMLPLTITMNELNGNEKYYYFDNNLPSNQSKIGIINEGDIMLYGNDCLVLFYEKFNTSYSYTKIGNIDNANNLKKDLGNSNVNITFSR